MLKKNGGNVFGPNWIVRFNEAHQSKAQQYQNG
jgi:hypothetical protein